MDELFPTRHPLKPWKGGPVARSTDPGTSWAAARSLSKGQVRSSQGQVLEILKDKGPLTDFEIYSWLAFNAGKAMSSSGARTRRKELVDLGLVRSSGRTVQLANGRHSIRWEAVA